MEDSLKKRYSIKLIANVVNALINAVLIAIVPKALGPVPYGQFVFVQDFFAKIIGFLDMGSSTAFFTKLSAKHTRKELITFYFLYSLGVFFFLSSAIVLIHRSNLNAALLPDIPAVYIYLGLIYGFLTWVTQIFIKISDAYALTVSVELIKIGHRIVSLFFLFYCVYFTLFDLQTYFYYNYAVLALFLIVIGWLFVQKKIFDRQILSFDFSVKKIAKEFIDYCHPLVVSGVIGMSIGIFDIWLLQTMGGSEQMGFYGLSYSLAAMCFLFTSAMTPIITREFSKSYEHKNIEQMQKLFYRYIPMLYSLAAFFAVFISFQNENVLLIFADEKFKEAHWVLVVMALYPIHQTYGQLSGSVFHATGQTSRYRNIGISSALIGLCFSLLFIYFFDLGAMGLAYKMVLTQLVGVTVQLYYNSKFLALDLRYFLRHQITALLFFVLIAYAATRLTPIATPLASFLVSGFIYTVLVIIFGYLFPSVFATTHDEIKTTLAKVLNVAKK
ncbi:polysaccharide biosynthesis protein [Sulfuricurvum kujiense DSM 16994]|uniref:Polysaccharide biosynthesis protein n=1 Tax=Sulfuricurvum kujiense (strain ATCC BAA-921 / DSM 16994 / JCM 11577 / YK-1) TaxID=709032 RepID=E4TYA6_SULKY|nr:oligosaccharide flippase family protein [Sulfuricurvum kujiense]ADR35051.1 polysaccharide biosynthesis protein [Sulfuricurvum kujiense DSM 16994]